MTTPSFTNAQNVALLETNLHIPPLRPAARRGSHRGKVAGCGRGVLSFFGLQHVFLPFKLEWQHLVPKFVTSVPGGIIFCLLYLHQRRRHRPGVRHVGLEQGAGCARHGRVRDRGHEPGVRRADVQRFGRPGREHVPVRKVAWRPILVLVLLAGCGGCGGAPGAPAPTATADPIKDMADEFKDLRAIEGHFDGGAWNDDVDEWMGRKHQLLIELGDTLGGGAHSRTQVIDLLGAPDAIAREGDALYDLIRERAEFERPAGDAYAFLVYHWRGEHDLFYLTVRGETILGAGWWYAGE